MPNLQYVNRDYYVYLTCCYKSCYVIVIAIPYKFCVDLVSQ